jgi:hypothetical protein
MNPIQLAPEKVETITLACIALHNFLVLPVGRLGGLKPPPLVLLPHLVQLSKNSRRRSETARHFFTCPWKRRLFSLMLLSLRQKTA